MTSLDKISVREEVGKLETVANHRRVETVTVATVDTCNVCGSPLDGVGITWDTQHLGQPPLWIPAQGSMMWREVL